MAPKRHLRVFDQGCYSLHAPRREFVFPLSCNEVVPGVNPRRPKLLLRRGANTIGVNERVLEHGFGAAPSWRAGDVSSQSSRRMQPISCGGWSAKLVWAPTAPILGRCFRPHRRGAVRGGQKSIPRIPQRAAVSSTILRISSLAISLCYSAEPVPNPAKPEPNRLSAVRYQPPAALRADF